MALVDSSIWIDYFRGQGQPDVVDLLIEDNLVVANDLILAELIPALHLHKQKRLIALLREVKRHPIRIDWDDITQMQITCMRNGVNGVGIPDLIIAQNAIQNDLHLLCSDKHFDLMSKYVPLSLYLK
ncbi:MAG: PIN domain-containing protein [Verrucomicrobia bacterium]|nr:PIN domain-containing protein [Verrucomicrobiota bacterium]